MIICWVIVRGVLGDLWRSVFICFLVVNRIVLKIVIVVRGVFIFLYNFLGFLDVKVCFIVLMVLLYLGGCLGSGIGCDCSFILMVLNGCLINN